MLRRARVLVAAGLLSLGLGGCDRLPALWVVPPGVRELATVTWMPLTLEFFVRADVDPGSLEVRLDAVDVAAWLILEPVSPGVVRGLVSLLEELQSPRALGQ